MSEENTEVQPLFELNDAEVVRTGRTILHVDKFLFAKGENIALLGPNGAGKSTFVKLITREVMPLYREQPPVKFNGNPRATLVDVRKTLGIVSSTMQAQINVHLPAVDIVEGGLFGTLGLPRHVHPDERTHAKALEAMEMLGVAKLADQDIMTMSSGQARRVLFARALVHDPSTLLLDEPCTGLDPEGMYQLRGVMRQLAVEGRSVILVTHYPEDIIPAIDRVLLIKNAAIYADGKKEELLTGECMTKLFGVPLAVESNNGWYSLREKFGEGE